MDDRPIDEEFQRKRRTEMSNRVDDGGPAFPQPHPPEAFERAMVFADGTNILNRLRECNLRVPSMLKLLRAGCGRRKLIRAYFYSTAEKIARAKSVHGDDFLAGCRVVHGDTVRVSDGEREKCVDALLVADLIYHAATKNFDMAIVFSNDSDYRYALRRVEDFGCRSHLIAIGTHAPERLVDEADQYWCGSKDNLLRAGLAESTS